MKYPNGYGCVRKLSGKRRNPWTVIITTGWTPEGKQLRKYYGYYRTRAEAVKALSDYNDNPFDLSGLTFSDIYRKYSEYKFPSFTEQNIASYQSTYRQCPDIHDKPFSSLTYTDLQTAIDKTAPTTGRKMKILFSQMYQFALKRNLVGKDFTNLLETKAMGKSTLHMRFTHDEMEVLWANADNEYVQAILMLIYSGCRPSELYTLPSANVHLKEQYFEITHGKNDNAVRKVPIHYRTLPFFEHWLSYGTENLITTALRKPVTTITTNHAKPYFYDILDSIGILYYNNKQHHLHDARHTFASMWTEKRLSEIYRRKIQGHSGQGIGEQVYTHILIEDLIAEINKL